MMNQRGGGVEAGHDDQRIGRNLVNLRDGMRERAVAWPGRRNFDGAEQRQRVAARELRDNTGNRDRKQQRIERKMPKTGGRIGVGTEPSAEFVWRGRRSSSRASF